MTPKTITIAAAVNVSSAAAAGAAPGGRDTAALTCAAPK